MNSTESERTPARASRGGRRQAEETPIKIQVRNLDAWFGKQQVLRGVSMAIPAQQVTGVIGPSGCGKSTFIRCINRMHELVASAA